MASQRRRRPSIDFIPAMARAAAMRIVSGNILLTQSTNGHRKATNRSEKRMKVAKEIVEVKVSNLRLLSLVSVHHHQYDV